MIAEKPWTVDAVARLFLCIIATLCFAGILDGFLESPKLGLTDDARAFAQMALTAVFFQGAVFIWIGVFLRQNRLTWSGAFGLEAARQSKAVPWGILAALLFLPIALGVQYLTGLLIEHPVAQAAVQVLENADLPWGEQVFLGVIAVLVAPPAEEIVFRGILYPTIKQNGYPRAALWATSLLFGLMHFNLLSFLPLALFSFLLIFLYEKTGSLWASITAHSLFNFSNFLFLMSTAGPPLPAPVK